MKKLFVVLMVAVLISSALFATAQAESTAMPEFIEIGTAGTGGAYYPIGIAMAEILNTKLGTKATAQVTGGAVENIRLIQEGSVKIALTTTSSAYRGLKGVAPFTSANPRVAGLFSNLTQGVYQIAVRRGSGINNLNDLKGKRVSLGPQGGLGVELSSYVFQAAGFTINDVRATFLSYEESATMMMDGNLDAVIIQTALPNPALRQMEASGGKFDMIGIPEEVMQKVIADHPYFAKFTIPASMYGTPSEIMTLNSTNMAIIDANLSEQVVYDITKALFESIDAIRSSQPGAKQFNMKDAAQMPIPLHPGAKKYYIEQGVLVGGN
ncbi:MAG: hypothetical protein CVV52_02255 [Spirochaetae bacterium HGW-Spirochaetae-8]|nr:MAG: hypothetical protein CVV52_02255 [Spirochaetae bacterium HGW-Spirochaetae-8]